MSLADLGIKAGKLSWCLYLDVVGLCDDGSVADAAWLAALAALRQRAAPRLGRHPPHSPVALT